MVIADPMYKQLQIYVLRLNHGRYYVGQSENVFARIQRHKNNPSCQWVKMWRVDYVADIYNKTNHFDEDIITKKLMMQFGIQMVRGGTYYKPKLLRWQLSALQMEFDTAMHNCFKCGGQLRYGHQCKNTKLSTCYYCKQHGHRVLECPNLKEY